MKCGKFEVDPMVLVFLAWVVTMILLAGRLR